MAEVATEGRMSLFEHLGELRTRLIRCVIAIVVLGVVSLAFSRTLFGLLMKPVLDALPPDARSLIYTSGIEEINVLMKVGLYAGVFFSTPVVLWQIWGFIAPGLFPHERKFAAPFVLLGSLAFVLGTMFSYFVLLPTMFQFLLGGGDNEALQTRVRQAEAREQEALRYVRIGDFGDSALLAKEASEALGVKGDGQVVFEKSRSGMKETEVADRLAALGRLVEAAHEGAPRLSPMLRGVMEKRLTALQALDAHNLSAAADAVEDAAQKLTSGGEEATDALSICWSFEQHLAEARLAYRKVAWTRPMLSMSEQLTLVLVLELAVGVIFELPLVMAILAMLGIVKASFLMKYQRHAFIICLIVAAVITPTGDAVNLTIMTAPMVLCYEIGVLAAWIIEKRRAKTTAIAPLK